MRPNHGAVAAVLRARLTMASQALICATGLLLTAPAMAMADSAHFNISAQPLPAALKAFAVQANMQLLYQYSAVAGASGNAVIGDLDKHAALEQLLRGTGLAPVYSSESSATIRPIRPAASDESSSHSSATTSGLEHQQLEGGKIRVAEADRPENPAAASSAVDQPAPKLDEITVTARRRSESLQQVPIAISVFDQDTLQRHEIGTLSDLQQLVPSAYVSAYAHGNQQFFTLRGQGESGLNTGGGAGGGPAVVGYLSEVPAAISGPGLYYDLQSVQVLKGPQGTLFGRNTTGGAILFEPRRPNLKSLEGYGQAVKGDFSRYETQAAINAPLINGKLAIRVAGQLGSRAGYTDDVNTGVDYNNRHFQAARVGILFQPTNALENYFLGNYVAFNEHGPGTILAAANPANPFLGASILDYVSAQQSRGIRGTALGVKELDQGIFYNLINKTAVTLGEHLTLRNIFSYSKQQIRRQDDEDGTRLALLDSVGSVPGTWLVDQNTLTEELQLQGRSLTGAFDWQAGAFYEDDYSPNPDDRTYAQQLVLLPLYSNLDRADVGGSSFGLYGQGTYQLTRFVPGLRFTAGYRYTWDHVYEGYSLSFGASRTPVPGDPCASRPGASVPNCFIEAGASHGGRSYTVGFDYQASPAVLVYVVSRQGYKSGGFNIIAATVGDTSSPFFTYKPERLSDVEIGVKADWSLGGARGRTNVALYNSWYRDAQVNTSAIIDNLQEAVTANAARATIRGVEVENTLQPASFIELSLSYSYLDASYDRYVTPLGQDLTGLPYAYAPRNKASASMRLRAPLPRSVGDVWLGANFTYQDKVFAGFTTVDPGSFMPAYGLLGLRVDWEAIWGSGLDAAIFATNVTDKAYRAANEDLYSTIGTATTVYGEPRMIGASVRYRF